MGNEQSRRKKHGSSSSLGSRILRESVMSSHSYSNAKQFKEKEVANTSRSELHQLQNEAAHEHPVNIASSKNSLLHSSSTDSQRMTDFQDLEVFEHDCSVHMSTERFGDDVLLSEDKEASFKDLTDLVQHSQSCEIDCKLQPLFPITETQSKSNFVTLSFNDESSNVELIINKEITQLLNDVIEQAEAHGLLSAEQLAKSGYCLEMHTDSTACFENTSLDRYHRDIMTSSAEFQIIADVVGELVDKAASCCQVTDENKCAVQIPQNQNEICDSSNALDVYISKRNCDLENCRIIENKSLANAGEETNISAIYDVKRLLNEIVDSICSNFDCNLREMASDELCVPMESNLKFFHGDSLKEVSSSDAALDLNGNVSVTNMSMSTLKNADFSTQISDPVDVKVFDNASTFSGQISGAEFDFAPNLAELESGTSNSSTVVYVTTQQSKSVADSLNCGDLKLHDCSLLQQIPVKSSENVVHSHEIQNKQNDDSYVGNVLYLSSHNFSSADPHVADNQESLEIVSCLLNKILSEVVNMETNTLEAKMQDETFLPDDMTYSEACVADELTSASKGKNNLAVNKSKTYGSGFLQDDEPSFCLVGYLSNTEKSREISSVTPSNHCEQTSIGLSNVFEHAVNVKSQTDDVLSLQSVVELDGGYCAEKSNCCETKDALNQYTAHARTEIAEHDDIQSSSSTCQRSSCNIKPKAVYEDTVENFFVEDIKHPVVGNSQLNIRSQTVVPLAEIDCSCDSHYSNSVGSELLMDIRSSGGAEYLVDRYSQIKADGIGVVMVDRSPRDTDNIKDHGKQLDSDVSQVGAQSSVSDAGNTIETAIDLFVPVQNIDSVISDKLNTNESTKIFQKGNKMPVNTGSYSKNVVPPLVSLDVGSVGCTRSELVKHNATSNALEVAIASRSFVSIPEKESISIYGHDTCGDAAALCQSPTSVLHQPSNFEIARDIRLFDKGARLLKKKEDEEKKGLAAFNLVFLLYFLHA